MIFYLRVCGLVQLWLECHVSLVKALAHGMEEDWGLLDCREVCQEGMKECETCGEIELAAQMQYYLAWHAMTKVPHNLENVLAHTQVQRFSSRVLHDIFIHYNAEICTHNY